MLLKIFLPLGFLILPILIPLNKVGGKDNHLEGNINSTRWNVTGLDQLAWGNVAPTNTDRYWAHLVLAVFSIVYVCAVFFDELRGYIRLRQAYLTSPQHRLRASATTVLVTAIPRKWLSVEALDGLYDVFPGGVRNIWINRNFDELNEKVKRRNELALALEAAETELIRKCKKAQLKQRKAEAKKAGKGAAQAEEREKAAADNRASQMAMQSGVSSGNPHQVAHTVSEALHPETRSGGRGTSEESRRNRAFIPVVGGGLNAVGHGATVLGKSLLGGIKKVERGIDGHRTRNPDLVTDEGRIQDEQPGDGVGPGYHSARSSNESGIAPARDSPEQGRDVELRPSSENPEPSRPFWTRNASSHSKRSLKTDRNPQADEIPLTKPGTPDNLGGDDSLDPTPERQGHRRKAEDKTNGEEYPLAYHEDFERDCGEPLWQKYVKPKDRETMRLPIFGLSWMPSLPLIGKKVDTIDYCRKEVARLNLEIEVDQQHPERFPLMNSAFIQFNHQVAAHMACQAVNHHIPKQMAPRTVEISPDDVIWDNMSMTWWERYLRAFGIIIVVCGMVVGWAFPVAFTGLLSQLSYLEGKFTWLAWLSTLPEWVFSAIQGVLPPLFLAILMAVLPLILRFLTKTQGVQTGMAVELTVQNYYFAFLFVQLFLVVSISSSFSTIFDSFTNIVGWPELLAQNIPKSSNYFFSYMILQAMSVSAGALVQIFGLISWFILAPIFDNTARMKWGRTTNLNQMQWGTFFPVYTTLASIGECNQLLFFEPSFERFLTNKSLGLIYSIIAPLIIVFNVITFGLFWFVYRYNTLFVTKFRFDTGGLLFPRAINQLFTGIYVMELCLIGLFFLVRDVNGAVACKGQAITMIVVSLLTVGYQYFLNEAFSPLIRYLPITLEDDAVRRDEEFARAQRTRLGLPLEDDDDDQESIDRELKEREHEDQAADRRAQEIELRNIEVAKGERKGERKHHYGLPTKNINVLGNVAKLAGKSNSWAHRSRNRRSKFFGENNGGGIPSIQSMREKLAQDEEGQGPATKTIGHALFAGIHDELEDLTPDERDQLVQRAFQHDALRARRPVIWIPRDDIGVSDDEIYRTQRFSKHIWISNDYQALDGECRTIFSRSPPDFSEVDLIQL
jgi:hypothetical protein